MILEKLLKLGVAMRARPSTSKGELMKKMIFAAILFPLFASAQTTWNIEQDSNYSTEATVEQLTSDSEMSVDLSSETSTDMEIAGRGHKTERCGRYSDFKCSERRVFETCERDNSHGIYGSCRDIGKRGGEVICSCR